MASGVNADSLTTRILEDWDGSSRYLCAVAGPPGAGKSTVSGRLRDRINERIEKPVAEIVPMDGFHLDNARLDDLGLRQRKGAPQTFDAHGFIELIKRIRSDTGTVLVPGFDRASDAVVADAAQIGPEDRIILIEGNYLLLDEDPWSDLRPLFDLAIFINPGIDVLEKRLIERWIDHGMDSDSARNRALSNDIPNARLVCSKSAEADILIA